MSFVVSGRRMSVAAATLVAFACNTPTPVERPTADADIDANQREDAGVVQLEPLSPTGGTLTVHDVSRDAFSRRSPATLVEHRSTFVVGNSFFSQSWVFAPASTTAIDGLGPLFNARSCAGCHFKDGRGRVLAAPENQVSALVRIGARGRERFGGQIQPLAMPTIPVEARIAITYREEITTINLEPRAPEMFALERPVVSVSVHDQIADVDSSLRVAPVVFGGGLLEAVTDEELLQRDDPLDRDGDGVSGRAARITDPVSAHTVGRFGWRAVFASLHGQSAGAFAGDMGLTTSVFPQTPCTLAQTECASAISGGAPEVDDNILDQVVDYMRLLGVPAQRTPESVTVLRGRQVFHEVGCESCHRETLHTPSATSLPELAEQTFHPYTDLLLHDMGNALADDVLEGNAERNEWRTPALWGLGLVPTVNGHNTLLHDGRARGFQEAILWHAGEAQQARARYLLRDDSDREALIEFLQSL